MKNKDCLQSKRPFVAAPSLKYSLHMLQVGIFFHTFIVAKTTNIIIRPHAWYKQFNKQEKLKDTKGIEVRFQNETHSLVQPQLQF